MPLTIPENIDIAEVSTYLAADDISLGQLYSPRLDPNLPMTLEMVLYAANWRYFYEGVRNEVRAIGYVTITAVGNDGDNIAIKVQDPTLGLISIVEYIKQTVVTTPAECAQAIVNTFNLYWGQYGYGCTRSGDSVVITVRQGLGDLLNGGSNLSVVAPSTPGTRANVYLSPSSVSTGTVFTVTVNDPNLGLITLATYTQQAGDTTQAIFISNLIAAINGNSYGYTSTPYQTYAFYILAPLSLGSSINGNRATVAWNASTTYDDFVGGVTAGGILTTLTQFAGGITEVLPSDGLVKTVNYMNWLDRNYGMEAQVIIDGNGGTPVTPVSPNGYFYYSLIHTIELSETGVNTFSHPALYLGKNVTSMMVNNSPYTLGTDFAFNPDTDNHTKGTITWLSGVFETGNTLIINFSRLI